MKLIEPSLHERLEKERGNPTKQQRHMQRGAIKIERLIQRGIRHNPFPRKKPDASS